MSSVCLLSGGLDSAVLLASVPDVQLALSFDYHQRNRRELQAASQLAAHYDVAHRTELVSAFVAAPNSLTGVMTVPHGHYLDPEASANVVPGRNLIFLSIAASIAEQVEADRVLFAAHAHPVPGNVYPDTTPEFILAIRAAIRLSTRGKVRLDTPMIARTKGRIVEIGASLGVPFDLTWSCYEAGEQHCGRCGTCVERAEAFYEAAVPDPTVYTDPNYWATVT